jgi:hypothetical protein
MPAVFDVLMVDGKAQFQSDEVKARYLQRAIAVEDIRGVTGGFRDLAQLVADTWAELAMSTTPSLDKLRERLAALPNLPRPKDQSQPSEAPKRRPRSSRVKYQPRER